MKVAGMMSLEQAQAEATRRWAALGGFACVYDKGEPIETRATHPCEVGIWSDSGKHVKRVVLGGAETFEAAFQRADAREARPAAKRKPKLQHLKALPQNELPLRRRMARARMLSGSICFSERLGSLSCDGARLLFTWMVTQADNLGRLRGEPIFVKATVLPKTPATVPQVDKWLAELNTVGLIRWYANQGNRFVYIEGWEKHQKLHHTLARSSELPEPPGPHADITVNSPRLYGDLTENSRLEVELEVEGEGEVEGDSVNAVDDVSVFCEWGEAFDAHFWRLYPRKVSKEEARSSWRKLHDPRGTLAEHEALLGRIMAGLHWYCDDEWIARDQDKIPHAATWLNQRRWEDAFDEAARDDAAAP
jgi:hypothetical protein